MADYDGMKPGEVLADASVAEFIKTLGLSIAEAQKALDENSVNQIAEFIQPLEGLGGKTLLDLGLSPAFYHYQHADITCSMQLSLKVEKDFSLGLNLNGSYGNTTTENNSSNASETTTESRSSTRTETREARVNITSASAGSLTVGGRAFPLTGSSPAERIRNLQNALTGDPSTGIARVMHELTPTPLTITTDAPLEKVRTTENTVAFFGGGFGRALIRIAQNTDTNYTLDTGKIANTTAQSTIEAYANHTRDQIIAQQYNATVLAPNENLGTFDNFGTGDHDLKPEWATRLDALAREIVAQNTPVNIQGFTDRQTYSGGVAASDAQNQRLGDRRAREIRNALHARGVPTSLLNVTTSTGEQAAQQAGDTRGQNNGSFRRVDVTSARTHYLIRVEARDGGPTLGPPSRISPNKIGDSGDTNGYIMLDRPSALNLSGKSVTIDTHNFPFRGDAAGGNAERHPNSYAQNLAADINGNTAAGLQASANANVVTISRAGDQFSLSLITAETRNISISGTEGITVTESFSRTTSSNLTQQNTGNRTVAVGASLDVRFSRKFEMNVTGNSSISARLVSIPAPPQFLETIKEYLSEG